MIVLRSLALYGKLFFGFKSKALYLNKIEFMKMAKESEEETPIDPKTENSGMEQKRSSLSHNTSQLP